MLKLLLFTGSALGVPRVSALQVHTIVQASAVVRCSLQHIADLHKHTCGTNAYLTNVSGREVTCAAWLADDAGTTSAIRDGDTYSAASAQLFVHLQKCAA